MVRLQRFLHNVKPEWSLVLRVPTGILFMHPGSDDNYADAHYSHLLCHWRRETTLDFAVGYGQSNFAGDSTAISLDITTDGAQTQVPELAAASLAAGGFLHWPGLRRRSGLFG